MATRILGHVVKDTVGNETQINQFTVHRRPRVKPNCKEQAKAALDTVLYIFQHITLDAEWHPKFIDLKSWIPKPFRKSRPLKIIKSYPGYTVAKKLGINLEIKHGDRNCGSAGAYSFTYTPLGSILTQKCVTLHVLNIETWLHELCHAVSCELDADRFFELQAARNPNLILETEATLGAAALLAFWQPAGYEGELRHGLRCIKDGAKRNERDLLEICEEVRANVEKQVAFILETENEH